MFGIGKHQVKLNSTLVRYLNEIDYKYMEAYHARSLRGLSPYFTEEAVIQVTPMIHQLGGRNFGTEKFRNTEWELLDQNEAYAVVRKTVKFDRITLGAGLVVGVADDYIEDWVLSITEKPYKVYSITLYRS